MTALEYSRDENEFLIESWNFIVFLFLDSSSALQIYSTNPWKASSHQTRSRLQPLVEHSFGQIDGHQRNRSDVAQLVFAVSVYIYFWNSHFNLAAVCYDDCSFVLTVNVNNSLVNSNYMLSSIDRNQMNA